MKLYLNFNFNLLCKKAVQNVLNKSGMKYNLPAFGEVEFSETISAEELGKISSCLLEYGIEVMDDPKNILVQKIKDKIVEMVYSDEKLTSSKTSAYLAEKLNYSYGYLSNLFSDVTFTSIENYIIMQRIERAKHLMLTNDLTFTEISWRLNYSSVAHFSTQFKNTTGLTPSAFQRIISKRRNPDEQTK